MREGRRFRGAVCPRLAKMTSVCSVSMAFFALPGIVLRGRERSVGGGPYGLQSVADFVVCGLVHREILAVGVFHIVGVGNHRTNQSGVVDDRFDAVLTRFAFDVAVRLAVCAHVGEVVDEEGFARCGRGDDRDLPALAVLETQNEIAVMGDLRRDALRPEHARGDAVHGHQPFAAAGDGVRIESAGPRAVRFEFGHVSGQHQFRHGGAAYIAGADKQNLHCVPFRNALYGLRGCAPRLCKKKPGKVPGFFLR